MREIKFRVFNTINKLMYDVGEIHFCHGGIKVEGQGVHIANGWAEISKDNNEKPELILMQYTGLKDVNGKEIYEGDILLLDEDFKTKREFERNHILVCFEEGAFMIGGLVDPYLMTSYLWPSARSNAAKIIGNIHENPELLEIEK